MRSFLLSRPFLPFLFLFTVVVGGCSVFQYIGDSISNGYQNTVAYFNSYYNASRMFNDAEAEIATADQAAGIRGFSDKPPVIQTAVRQKLTTVIDKCSNILQFYPSSALVDDALFLVGKSYYYQADYLKAERKFTEFLSGYPDSPLNLDVRLWYVKTLARLKKDEQAASAGEALLADSERQNEPEIAAAVADVLGVLYERTERADRSLAMYSRLRELAPDEETKAWGCFRAGEKLKALGKVAEASEMFRLAAEYSDDPMFQCRSSLEYVDCLRTLGKLDVALNTANSMLDDYRYEKNRREILFERGLTHKAAGRIDDAINDLVVVDTTSGRTELGAKAAFELGKLYEQEKGDYRSARESYTRATAFPVADLIVVARRKQSGFTRYATLNDALGKLDSLISAGSGPDTAAVDSAKSRLAAARLDSLRALQAANWYELAELFYVDIENPDSAAYWFKKSLDEIADTVRTPRITYMLAELALSNPDRGYGDGKALLHSIIDSYPRSIYALRAKMQLGLPVDHPETDSSETLFKAAEATIDSGNYSTAITKLRKISAQYPLSPFAAKSIYTAGWLYENRLSQPDSALNQYTILVQTYGATPYAAAVRAKIRTAKTTPADSTAVSRELKKKKESEQ